MEIQEFTRALGRLSGDDFRLVAAALDTHDRSAGEEVDAWRAILHIDAVLRATGRSRAAAVAAHRATLAVRATARATVPDRDAVRLARAAAMIARGLVAGEAAATDLRPLLDDWAPVLSFALVWDAA